MKKFKKYNIDPTDENVLIALKNDTYERAKHIKNFIEGLNLIDTNMFISLDARWGEGKTFYVRQIEMTLRYYLKKSFGENVDDLAPYFSKSKLQTIQLEKRYLPIYYNAWLHDYHKDPLMSLIHVLVKECGKYISTVMDNNNIIDKLLSLLSPFSLTLPFWQISGDWKNIKETLSGKDILEEIKTAEEIHEIVKQILDEIIVEKADKLVIFIDELDRCKPDFAIETLERIKHYFDDERIIFIVSVNKEQLVHTISKFYGNSFDSTGYLNKFFDINIYLPEIPQYLKENTILQISREQYHLKKIAEDLGKYYNLSLRDTIIFYQDINSVSIQYCNNYSAEGFVLSIFIPIILVLGIVNQTEGSRFLKGRGDTFKELCENLPNMRKIICRFGDRSGDENEDYRVGFERVYKVYECTFSSNKIYDGDLEISRNLKELCIQACNGDNKN